MNRLLLLLVLLLVVKPAAKPLVAYDQSRLADAKLLLLAIGPSAATDLRKQAVDQLLAFNGEQWAQLHSSFPGVLHKPVVARRLEHVLIHRGIQLAQEEDLRLPTLSVSLARAIKGVHETQDVMGRLNSAWVHVANEMGRPAASASLLTAVRREVAKGPDYVEPPPLRYTRIEHYQDPRSIPVQLCSLTLGAIGAAIADANDSSTEGGVAKFFATFIIETVILTALIQTIGAIFGSF